MVKGKLFRTFFKKESIYETFKLFFYISKFFGFSCFKIDFRTKKVTFNFFSLWIFLTSISVWILISWSSMLQLERETQTDLKFTKATFISSIHRIYSAFNPCMMIFVIIFHNSRRKNIGTFLRKIYNFDESLKKLRWEFQYANDNLYVVVVLLIIIGLMILKMRFILYHLTWDGWKNIMFYAGVVLDVPALVIILSHFILSSCSVLIRAQILRKNFESMQHYGLSKSLAKEKLIFNNFTRLYKMLIDAVDEINSVFSIEVRVKRVFIRGEVFLFLR